MKNFKLLLLSFVIITGFLTSCSNNEPLVEEEQNIQESQAITTSLNQLRQQYNAEGDIIADDNPSGNIVFDFCFDFVYPLNLSYNNGTTVSVDSLDDLILILINSTNELYISGIAFPFDVEAFDDDSDAIEIITINNEEEFLDLLEDCDFNNVIQCVCTEDFDPVCVEVEAPDGESFIVTYPNACFAQCDGFTEEDFVDNCEEDYNCPGGTDCFTFNFPLTIITDNNETITVNSQEELDNALYNAYYFDFVYPFEVTLEEGEVVTVGSVEDLEDLLDECFDDYGNPNCDCNDDDLEPVCVEYDSGSGQVQILVFPNACIAECEGFSEEDFVDCDGDNGNSDCTPNDIFLLVTECSWSVGNYTYTFDSDGVVEITDNASTITGLWFIGNTGGTSPASIIIQGDQNMTDEWFFSGCDDDDVIVTSTVNPAIPVLYNCD
ncbi:hypothetical protein [uncultured Psychroserpens sp.]|uniref:hypothetical protein n=1 Tax=uncultured Psychroserpens sp. TaxID=255436 RepID=UPI0026166204|nr:hypothetical protein [uncultured Psychroserpens sp.]